MVEEEEAEDEGPLAAMFASACVTRFVGAHTWPGHDQLVGRRSSPLSPSPSAPSAGQRHNVGDNGASTRWSSSNLRARVRRPARICLFYMCAPVWVCVQRVSRGSGAVGQWRVEVGPAEMGSPLTRYSSPNHHHDKLISMREWWLLLRGPQSCASPARRRPHIGAGRWTTFCNNKVQSKSRLAKERALFLIMAPGLPPPSWPRVCVSFMCRVDTEKSRFADA